MAQRLEAGRGLTTVELDKSGPGERIERLVIDTNA